MNVISSEKNQFPPGTLDRIITALQNGGMVVLPTDTSYLLGVDSLNARAVKKLFVLKNRPFDQPVSLCFANIEMAACYTDFSNLAKKIAEKYLPGPLTLVLPVLREFPESLMKNKKIGVRIPNTSITLDAVRRFGKPITATSANKSGGHEPYDVSTVIRELGDQSIDIVLDAGPLPPTPASTIVEIDCDSARILRKGPITLDDIKDM